MTSKYLAAGSDFSWWPDPEPRTVVWFSAGAASAVAAKLMVAEKAENLVIAYTDPGSEHPDSKPIWLDELDPNSGAINDEPSFECSMLCHNAEEVING